MATSGKRRGRRAPGTKRRGRRVAPPSNGTSAPEAPGPAEALGPRLVANDGPQRRIPGMERQGLPALEAVLDGLKALDRKLAVQRKEREELQERAFAILDQEKRTKTGYDGGNGYQAEVLGSRRLKYQVPGSVEDAIEAKVEEPEEAAPETGGEAHP